MRRLRRAEALALRRAPGLLLRPGGGIKEELLRLRPERAVAVPVHTSAVARGGGTAVPPGAASAAARAAGAVAAARRRGGGGGAGGGAGELSDDVHVVQVSREGGVVGEELQRAQGGQLKIGGGRSAGGGVGAVIFLDPADASADVLEVSQGLLVGRKLVKHHIKLRQRAADAGWAVGKQLRR